MSGAFVNNNINKLFSFSNKVESSREAEVADLHLHVIIEEEIPEFQVAMNDSLLVQKVTGEDDLSHEITTFRLRNGTTSLVQLHQRLFSNG